MTDFEFLERCRYAHLDSRIGSCLEYIDPDCDEVRHSGYCRNCTTSRIIGSLDWEIAQYNNALQRGKYRAAVKRLCDFLTRIGKNEAYDVGCQSVWNRYME